MIQQTVERLKPLAKAEKTWVITNEYLAQEIAEQLSGVPVKQIIQEPVPAILRRRAAWLHFSLSAKIPMPCSAFSLPIT